MDEINTIDSVIDDLENLKDQLDTDSDEQVYFFEPDRELIITHPDPDTREQVSNVAHVEGTDGDSIKYGIRRMDIWRSHLDLDDLKATYRSILPDRYPHFMEWVERTWKRGTMFQIEEHDGKNVLVAANQDKMEWARNRLRDELDGRVFYKHLSDTRSVLTSGKRGDVKEKLLDAGYPVTDNGVYVEPDKDIGLDLDGVTLRDTQEKYRDQLYDLKAGVLANPSGSGKTVTTIGLMAKINKPVLILVPEVSLIDQWRDELEDKTNAGELFGPSIAEYHGRNKSINDITLTTYHTATQNKAVFDDREWGLIVFDEAHHIPASIFRQTAQFQSTRRVGLSASPVREDDKEEDIFTLIGPEIGGEWSQFFDKGHAQKPDVSLWLVPWDSKRSRNQYHGAEGWKRIKISAVNRTKIDKLRVIQADNSYDKELIFVDWIDHGEQLSDELDIPFVSGGSSKRQRQNKFDKFRTGDLDALILSRIGDEGVDLPNADAVYILSGLGSSRRQATQRAGRVMRPVGDSDVHFIATKDTNEESFVKDAVDYLKSKGIQVTVNDHS